MITIGTLYAQCSFLLVHVELRDLLTFFSRTQQISKSLHSIYSDNNPFACLAKHCMARSNLTISLTFVQDQSSFELCACATDPRFDLPLPGIRAVRCFTLGKPVYRLFRTYSEKYSPLLPQVDTSIRTRLAYPEYRIDIDTLLPNEYPLLSVRNGSMCGERMRLHIPVDFDIDSHCVLLLW